MNIDELPSVLIPLGFTETEALVYGELLRQPDQTGYGLSKAIHKGQPVTYAALAGLEGKGAVMASLAPARVYRAIPPAELITALRTQFERRCALAKDRLVERPASLGSDQLFQLKSTQQVLERARSMIGAATSTVLFEMFPPLADELRPNLMAAATRDGVEVVGVVLRHEDHIEAARTIVPALADRIRLAWNQDVIALIVDARQVLIASIDAYGAVSHAVWTDNLFFSVLFHNSIAADVLLHDKMGADWVGPNMDLFGKIPPGFTDLIAGA